jgi:hypothetical protein
MGDADGRQQWIPALLRCGAGGADGRLCDQREQGRPATGRLDIQNRNDVHLNGRAVQMYVVILYFDIKLFHI